MSDNIAVLQGYTKGYIATTSELNLFILVKPDQDLDERFKCWDSDNQEFIFINGWLFSFEETND